jgi:hypothetical protein
MLSLGFNWKISASRRKLLVISFIIDAGVTAATFIYFAPEAGVIASTRFDAGYVDSALFERAQLWKSLNLLRLGAFYIVAIMLLFAVNKNITERHLAKIV